MPRAMYGLITLGLITTSGCLALEMPERLRGEGPEMRAGAYPDPDQPALHRVLCGTRYIPVLPPVPTLPRSPAEPEQKEVCSKPIGGS